MRNAECVPRSSTRAICSTAPAWRPMMPGMMSTQGKLRWMLKPTIARGASSSAPRNSSSAITRRDRSRGVCLTSARPTPIPSVITTGDWPRRTPELSSARQRAAAAFNEIASAAKIAIAALSRIARNLAARSRSFSVLRKRLSGSPRPRRIAIPSEGPFRKPHRPHRRPNFAQAAPPALGQRARSVVARCR